MASWLKNAVFYEIYPQSFNDTNADGIGKVHSEFPEAAFISEWSEPDKALYYA